MSMTEAQFKQLVRKLETFSRKQPANYKLRVRMLAVMGYVYILAVLIIIAVLSALFFPVLFSWIQALSEARTRAGGRIIVLLLIFGVGLPLVLLFSIVNALWIYIPAPEGVAVNRRQVPRLFQLIDEFQRELRTPRFHRVLLTDEFNAAVMQRPRLGIFGGYQNYLILGLPLMQTLAPAEFRAVLAHELGHISGKHGQFGHWIYRLRYSWEQILESFQKTATQGQHAGENAIGLMLALAGSLGFYLFYGFFSWYVPFFSAYSFVLARADEYEADRYSAKLAGAKNLASALVSLEIKGGYLLPAFWSEMRDQANADTLPNPYSDLSASMRRAIAPEQAKTLLQQVLAEETGYVDTHPCLKDRLAALGCRPNQVPGLLKPVKGTAAQQFLGQALPHILKHFNQTWQQTFGGAWQHRQRQLQQQKERLAELEQKKTTQPKPATASRSPTLPQGQKAESPTQSSAQSSTQSPVQPVSQAAESSAGTATGQAVEPLQTGVEGQSLSLDQLWERAVLKIKLKQLEAAIPDLKAVLAEYPNHQDSNRLLGHILLERGERAGIQYLETAMKQNSNLFLDGAKLIYAFLQEQDGEEAAERYLAQAKQQYEIVNKARLERTGVSQNHALALPALPDAERQSMQQQLSQYQTIKAAYLVQKVVQYLPESPFYVLAIESESSMFDDMALSQDDKLMNKLANELRFSGELYLVLLDSEELALKIKLRQMEGALIYPQT